MRLSDIAAVISGPLVSRYVNKNNNSQETLRSIRMITPKAIGKGFLHLEEAGREELVKEIDKQFFTRQGDILLQLSRPYSSALVMEVEEEGLLFPSYIVALRVLKEEDRLYLLSYLSSEHFLDNLERNTNSSLRSLISINALKNLEIPEIPHKQEAGRNFLKAVRTLKLAEEIFTLESASIDSIIKEAAH